MKNNFSISEYLTDFQVEYKELVHKLKNTNHAFDEENVNPFHIEDNVWTHTMMVLLQARNFSNNKINLLCALFHDLGKVYAIDKIEEGKKSTFYGHEGISTFVSVEILEHLIKDEIVTKDEAIDILYIINWHGILFNHISEENKIKNAKKLSQRFMFKQDLFKLFLEQVKNDMTGRFSNHTTSRELLDDLFLNEDFFDLIREDEKIFKNKPETNRFVHVLSGVPGSGKTTWVNKNVKKDENTILISRDEFMLDYYKKEILKDESIENNTLNYEEVWKKTTYDKEIKHDKFIDKLVTKAFFSAVKDKKNIFIDMTNLSERSRRKWISSLPKTYKRVNTFFILSLEDLIRNNKHKDRINAGKSLDEYFLIKFSAAYFLPSYHEFDEINLKWDI